MSARCKAALLLAAMAAMMAFTQPAASMVPVDIELNNTDTTRQMTMAPNSELDGFLGMVIDRVVVQFANTLRQLAVGAPPPELVARLGQIAPRPVLSSVESTYMPLLSPPPGALAGYLAGIGQRIKLLSVESNRNLAVQYPAQLLKDRRPPAIAEPLSGGANIAWTTDEFTSSVVRYGPTRGDLSMAVMDTSFQKVHRATLQGMGPTTTLFAQITSTDQSGNVTNSAVYQVSGIRNVYMPNVLNQRNK
jgi:hypothetical protein